ncbi:MAG: type IV pilus modification protein PilV [Thiolinea sp.]
MKRTSLHRQAGLNFIEVLVAALILSIGMLSLAGLQVASLKSSNNATQKQQAAFIVHELFERMRGNREAALAGAYSVSNYSCNGTAVPDCGGTTACSETQLASYDIHQVQCGSDAAAATDAGINEQLLNGRLTIRCNTTTGDCNDGVEVNLVWSERLTTDKVTGRDVGGNVLDDHTEESELTVNATL